jgi:hypothetical protein
MLVSIGMLITSWFNAAKDTAEYGPDVIGVALAIVGVASTFTAIHRWAQGYRIMKSRERGAAESAPTERKARESEEPKRRRVGDISSKHHPIA